MNLDRLTVVHARKQAGHALPGTRETRDADRLFIETCLRLIWLDLDAADDMAGLATRMDGELLHGQDAYRLLLEIGCGLHSAIPGEAEVFGQIRSFWKRFGTTVPAHARRLEPLMQRLLEDIKDIRTRHLQGLGGATYGSLARLLLGDDLHKPTLLVGAGKMARAVAPYLTGRPLYLWNRTAGRLDEVTHALGPNPQQTAHIHRLPADPAAELAAWHQAGTVVLCVPPDNETDRARLTAWQCAPARARIVHLGVLSARDTEWATVPSLSTLQDLFDLRDTRNELRAAPLARARTTCAEKARLRNLGGSPTLAHGWEDLPFTLTA